MKGVERRRFRDIVAVGGLAGLLAIAFTFALAGGQDPNYALQPNREAPEQVAAGLDCEFLRNSFELLGEPTGSSDDWQYRRDLWRASRILDCDP